MAGRAIDFLERHIGIDIDGNGAVGGTKSVVAEVATYEEEEEDEVILESEKEAARRAFAALLEREGSFPESSDSSSEEEPDVARAMVGPAHVEKIRLPDSIRNRYTFLELLHENHGRRVYFCNAHQDDGREDGRCVLKVWYKSAHKPAMLDDIIKTQLELMDLERHVNIIQPHRIFEDELCYYVEFHAVFSGSSLLQSIVSDASTTEKWIKRIFRGIFRGLGHLHQNGLTHGDIKPENVLLEWKDYRQLLSKHAKNPKAWLSVKKSVRRWKCPTHFKTAWTRHQLVAHVRIIDLDTASRNPQGICGTPGYMAPEEYISDSSPAGDLFAAGVILYQLIRCNCPFHETVFRVLRGRPLDEVSTHTREELADAVSLVANTTDWTEHPWPALPKARDLCRQLLRADPEERGGDATSVMATSPWLNPRVGKHLKTLVRRTTTKMSGTNTGGLSGNLTAYASTRSTGRMTSRLGTRGFG